MSLVAWIYDVHPLPSAVSHLPHEPTGNSQQAPPTVEVRDDGAESLHKNLFRFQRGNWGGTMR